MTIYQKFWMKIHDWAERLWHCAYYKAYPAPKITDGADGVGWQYTYVFRDKQGNPIGPDEAPVVYHCEILIYDCDCVCHPKGKCPTKPCDQPAVGKSRGLWMCEEHLDFTMDGAEFMKFGKEADPLLPTKAVKSTQVVEPPR